MILYGRRVGGDHDRHQQLVVALLLEVAQVEGVIVDLIVGGRAILAVTAFELEQEHDVMVQHDVVNALAHARDAVLEQDVALVESTELVLQDLDFQLPRVALLDAGVRGNVVRVDHTRDLRRALPQKIFNCRVVITP